MNYISTLAAGYSKRLCIGIIAVCLIVGRSDAATFHGLGMLPYGNRSFVMGLSADGKVAVGNATVPLGDTFQEHSFRWTETSGMESLGYTGMGFEFADEADAVSADGSFIVGCLDTQHVYVWNQSSGVQPLSDFEPPGGSVIHDIPYGISSNGEVIVSTYETPTNLPGTAICWIGTNAPIALIDGQPWGNTAVAVSDDGLVVIGKTFTNGAVYAYRFTPASGVQLLTDISDGFIRSEATAMSRDGGAIVGFGFLGDSAEQWFRWTAKTGAVGIGNAHGGDMDRPYGVSNDGNTVVGAGGRGTSVDLSDPDFADALIWRPQWGTRYLQDVLTNDYHLDLTGWHLRSARAVSTDGTVIVGNGINPSGQREAWIATIDNSGATPGEIAVYKVGAAYTQIGGFKVERPTVSGYMLMDLSSNNIVFIRTDFVKKTFHVSAPTVSVARINVSAACTDTAIKFQSDDMVSATAEGQNVNVAINYDSSTHPVNMAIPSVFTVGGFDILTSSTGQAVTRGYRGVIVLDRAATLAANKKGYDVISYSAALQGALVKRGYKVIP